MKWIDWIADRRKEIAVWNELIEEGYLDEEMRVKAEKRIEILDRQIETIIRVELK